MVVHQIFTNRVHVYISKRLAITISGQTIYNYLIFIIETKCPTDKYAYTIFSLYHIVVSAMYIPTYNAVYFSRKVNYEVAS